MLAKGRLRYQTQGIPMQTCALQAFRTFNLESFLTFLIIIYKLVVKIWGFLIFIRPLFSACVKFYFAVYIYDNKIKDICWKKGLYFKKKANEEIKEKLNWKSEKLF